MKNAIEVTAAALAALDFSEHNGKIADLEAQIAQYDEAIERARARLAEIGKAKRENAGPDGRAVGDALLASLTTAEAALAGPSADAMEQEQESLREGIRDLGRRSDDARNEIKLIKREAMFDISGAAAPLVEAIVDEARRAFEVIPRLYASLWAINLATTAGGRELNHLGEAVKGIQGMDRLLPWMRGQAVPPEITEMTRVLRDKGTAVRDARFVDMAPMP